jgi:hypothetical protein
MAVVSCLVWFGFDLVAVAVGSSENVCHDSSCCPLSEGTIRKVFFSKKSPNQMEPRKKKFAMHLISTEKKLQSKDFSG